MAARQTQEPTPIMPWKNKGQRVYDIRFSATDLNDAISGRSRDECFLILAVFRSLDNTNWIEQSLIYTSCRRCCKQLRILKQTKKILVVYFKTFWPVSNNNLPARECEDWLHVRDLFANVPWIAQHDCNWSPAHTQ